MTSAAFRVDTTLLAEARALVDSGIFKLMDQIVDLESPHRSSVQIAGDTVANIQLGRIMGFEERRQRFLELAQPLPKAPVEVEPTYTDSTREEPDA